MSADTLRFLCACLVAPLGVPYMLILVDRWRKPWSTIRQWVAVLLVIHLLYCAFLYSVLGPSRLSGTLASVVPVFLYWSLYSLTTQYRGGRFFFTIVTVGILSTMSDTVAGLLFPYATVPYLAARIAVTGLFSLVLGLWCRKPFLRMLHSAEQGWVPMGVFPLVFWIILFLCYDMPMTLDGGVYNPPAAVLLLAAIPACYVFLYRFLQGLVGQYLTRQDAALLRAQVQALERQSDQFRENDRNNRIFRHDLRHYLRLMDAALAAGDGASAQTTLRRMEAELDALPAVGALRAYTGNAALDTVLSFYADRAREAEISFQVQLALPEDLRVDTTELAVVLSNALENALHACAAQPAGQPRRILVCDRPSGRQFFLSVSNTFSGALALDGDTGLPLSQRPGHGYGTQSIAAFAKKYNAILHYAVEEDTVCMSLLF